ncbi:MAG: hypothetical protein WCQ59_06375 [Candidatus Cloacimonadaceae bacterium]
MSESFVVKDLGMKKAIASIKGLNKSFVVVGLPGAGSPAVMENGGKGFIGPMKPTGLTVAVLGVIHEYGSPANGIPARPFMKQTWLTYRDQTRKLTQSLLKQVTSGKVTVHMGLSRLGIWYEGKMKTTVRRGQFVPNAAETIRQKGSSKPLIDTGLMRASITHKVEMH